MLAPWIISQFPSHRNYTEPFGGGASILLRKRRSYSEVYNDMDGDIVNVFKVLQGNDTSKELQRLLFLTPYSRSEFKASYELSNDPIERARRTIIRSFMGFGSNAHNIDFNSGFRANNNRAGTTPAHDWSNYPFQIPRFCERLKGVVIENRDGFEIITQQDKPEALHYCDPPYVHTTRYDKMAGNYVYEMTDEEHMHLSEILHVADGMVILSGYQSELYGELYHDWKRIDRATHADGAKDRIESLWFNKRAFENQPQVEIPFFTQDGELTL